MKTIHVTAALLFAVPLFAQQGPAEPPQRPAVVVKAESFDVSPPLRDIVPLQSHPGDHVDVDFEMPLHGRKPGEDDEHGHSLRAGTSSIAPQSAMRAMP